MQTVNLTNEIDPEAGSNVTVQVPDDFTLARVPRGRGSLACWLAKLPNGSKLSARGTKVIPWNNGYRRDVELVKEGGQWKEVA